MYRIIHSSDWHLPGPPPTKGLTVKQWLGILSWRCQRHHRHRPEVFAAARRLWLQAKVDQFCFTGDLVNFAAPAEYRQAAAELAQLSRVAPISLVPGNHDALVASGWAEAQRIWAPWLGPDHSGADGIPVWRDGPVAVVGLSSARPTPPFMAWGEVAPVQLIALESVLAELRHRGHFRVVLVHHPPQPGATSWRRGLHGADALRAVLQRTGAELVLHGHMHHPVRTWLPGPEAPIPVFGAGSASYLTAQGGRPGAHFHQFAIDGDSAGWRVEITDYFHDPRTGVFHPSAPAALLAPA